ncbi:hypothetical protein ABZX50_07215 [Streptomyces misionensis]|uniref:hypothetical protein n=1 Tax=Streptomyces misionensis TaxID=67331 RepID=UPI0033BD2574
MLNARWAVVQPAPDARPAPVAACPPLVCPPLVWPPLRPVPVEPPLPPEPWEGLLCVPEPWVSEAPEAALDAEESLPPRSRCRCRRRR